MKADLSKRILPKKIYNSELDQQYVEMWGDQGGIGLVDLIYDQMKDKIFPDQNIQNPRTFTHSKLRALQSKDDQSDALTHNGKRGTVEI